MNIALVFSNVLAFMKKNWQIIGIILLLLWFSGVAKQWFNRLAVSSQVGKYKEDPLSLDYKFLSMQMNASLDKALWFSDAKGMIAIINSLNSQGEFLSLVRQFALDYHKDLRSELREKLTDRQYSELKFK